VHVSTFDGAIEIRPWDRSEVQVVVEKRGPSKEVVAEIVVTAEQHGNQVTVDAKAPKTETFSLHFSSSRSAKLIVSVPAESDVVARSCHGAVAVGRIA